MQLTLPHPGLTPLQLLTSASASGAFVDERAASLRNATPYVHTSANSSATSVTPAHTAVAGFGTAPNTGTRVYFFHLSPSKWWFHFSFTEVDYTEQEKQEREKCIIS